MYELLKKSARVLVVDDNRADATALGCLLSAAGYEVQTCFDPRDALATAGRFNPDACVLEINMPGMDGYELARRLRQNAPNHPPILATVTECEGEDHLDRAAAAGFDLHFSKPAVPAEVTEQLGVCMCR